MRYGDSRGHLPCTGERDELVQALRGRARVHGLSGELEAFAEVFRVSGSGDRAGSVEQDRLPRRTAAACSIAGWGAGAKRKPKPSSSIDRAIRTAGSSSSKPSASSTSAEPDADETARFPCLATPAPAAAATSAAPVEMISVCAPSPPVPA